MNSVSEPELLLLHALPLDGGMWTEQMGILPDSTYAPTLYSLGENIERWAVEALKLTHGNKVIVVGCSIGGACALEIARLAPDRVAALVLIGTKANCRPDPNLLASALAMVNQGGLHTAWEKYWEPLFDKNTSPKMIHHAKKMMLRQTKEDLARGVHAFHTRPSRGQTLSEFPRPIIFVTGKEDVAPGLETTIKQAAMTFNGQLHIIPDCGHYVPMERPDALNAILTKLIATI